MKIEHIWGHVLFSVFIFSLVIHGDFCLRDVMSMNFRDYYISQTIKYDQIPHVSPTRIVWSHATNSIVLLEHSMMVPVDFIEFDVCFDVLSKTPIVTHYRNDKTNFTLDAFIRHFIRLKLQTQNFDIGLKIDIKDEAALSPSILIMGKYQGDYWNVLSSTPILFHGDILEGPAGMTPVFHAKSFVQQCQDSGIKNIGISIGWTTGWSVSLVFNMHQYKTKHMDAALDIAARVNNTMRITFCLRASIFKNSKKALVRKIVTGNTMLTIWGDVARGEKNAILDSDVYESMYLDVKGPSSYIMSVVAIQIVLFLCMYTSLFYSVYTKEKQETDLNLETDQCT